MVFSDTYTMNGIVQMVDFLCGTDSTTYTLSDKARSANNWMRAVNTWIWAACGDWNYDDSNYSNLPEATNNLKANQRDYSLPDDYHNIIKVEVLDANGIWNKLEPITDEQMTLAEEETYKIAGTPLYYKLTANSIKLYPASNVDRNSALKLFLARDVSTFSPTDTTKSPGFNISFHPVIAYGMAFDYVLSTGQVDKIKIFKQIIDELELRIKDYYAVRNLDMRPRFIPRIENYK